jgi:RNA polymerase sigma-70 factor (ECF subfamily)
VCAIVRDESEAEDVVQHAYVQAYDNLSRYRGGGGFGAWLTSIALNEARSRSRRIKTNSEFLVLEGGGDTHVSELNPEDEAYRNEVATALEEKIDELADNLRVVFVLRDVQELDTKETAAALNTSEEVVRVRLHRARHQLQQRLSDLMASMPEAFRFDGERCDRMVSKVMRAVHSRSAERPFA